MTRTEHWRTVCTEPTVVGKGGKRQRGEWERGEWERGEWERGEWERGE